METAKKLNRRAVMIALIAICLAIAAVVGVSFARYITSGADVNDDAYSADWGVEIANGSDTNVFKDAYTEDGITYVKAQVDSYDVVAPGTSGSLLSYSLVGKPEVLTEVTYDFKVTLNDNWIINKTDSSAGTFYCPIVFTITDSAKTTTINGTDYTNADALETALDNAINASVTYFAPNTDLASATSATPTFSWAWNITGASSGAATTGQNDTNDTALGNLAAAATTNADKPGITITGDLTARQVTGSEVPTGTTIVDATSSSTTTK